MLIGGVPAWPPLVPEALKPNTSLFTAPSIKKLLYLLFWPPIEILWPFTFA